MIRINLERTTETPTPLIHQPNDNEWNEYCKKISRNSIFEYNKDKALPASLSCSSITTSHFANTNTS